MSDNQTPDRAFDEARPETTDERSGTADVTAGVDARHGAEDSNQE